MLATSLLETLRNRIHNAEEAQRRCSRTISVADGIDQSLPHGGLSAGCIHEVKSHSVASAMAFSAVLSSRLAGDQGVILCIGTDQSVHPIGLLPYGVKPDRLLYACARRPQDLAWTVMEALRCSQVSSVIALLAGLDLTESRRLQLAAEASGATGFFVSPASSALVAAPITRWKVPPVPDAPVQSFDEPVWALDLLYCRGGRSGSWIVQWRDQKLTRVPMQPPTQRANETLAAEALAG